MSTGKGRERAAREGAGAPSGAQAVTAQSAKEDITKVAAAAEVVARLLAANGCAWHREQTPLTLTKFLIEETAEAVAALENGSPQEITEELGDVLYQVLLHAEVGKQQQLGYDLGSIAETLAQKLTVRHPHVFGDMPPKTAAELTQMWQQLKQRSAGTVGVANPVFAGIVATMPTLARAQKMAQRLAQAGIDPQTVKIAADSEQAAAEYGAQLWQLIAAGAVAGVDMDQALRQTLLAISKDFA